MLCNCIILCIPLLRFKDDGDTIFQMKFVAIVGNINFVLEEMNVLIANNFVLRYPWTLTYSHDLIAKKKGTYKQIAHGFVHRGNGQFDEFP
jgi:hypothetical protein